MSPETLLQWLKLYWFHTLFLSLNRYVSPTSRRVVTRVLQLFQLDAHDTGADALWREFKTCLNNHGIPLTNVVGLACDNAAVLTGGRASFWTKLKEACSWAILINCICHTSASISKAACAQLPSFAEGHLRSISNYISCSPKRCAELQDFQVLFPIEKGKIWHKFVRDTLVLFFLSILNFNCSLLPLGVIRRRGPEGAEILDNQMARLPFMCGAVHWAPREFSRILPHNSSWRSKGSRSSKDPAGHEQSLYPSVYTSWNMY